MHNIPLWASSDFVAPLPRAPGDGESPAGPIFDIDVEQRADQPVIARVFGSVDLLTAPALRTCVNDHVGSPAGLVLDMTGVNFLAASGLTVLADTDRRARQDNLAWGLVASTRPVLRPLEVLGLDEALPTYESVPDAVAAVRAAALTG